MAKNLVHRLLSALRPHTFKEFLNVAPVLGIILILTELIYLVGTLIMMGLVAAARSFMPSVDIAWTPEKMSEATEWILLAWGFLGFALFGGPMYVSELLWPDMSEKNMDMFLKEWVGVYKTNARSIPLFDTGRTAKWTTGQKQTFVRRLYHARGHFGDFLWLLANETEDWTRRKVIVENIIDELGLSNFEDKAHERLFRDFAQAFDVDVGDEQTVMSYEDFLREFNAEHLEWISSHNENANWAMFSAYELLDNVDYTLLLSLGESIGATGDALAFFKIHVGSNHHQKAREELLKAWRADPDATKAAFEFIESHQLKMWKSLSDAVFAA